MITRQEFPYLQEFVINDVYPIKNLRVPVFEPGQEFKHLVLTGPNGSGKTTVLKKLAKSLLNRVQEQGISLLFSNPIAFAGVFGVGLPLNSIAAFFQARREVDVQKVVVSVTTEELFGTNNPQTSSTSLAPQFKQYLVNKKVFQVFDTMDGRIESAQQQEKFFTDLENHFRAIFFDSGLKLEFEREKFEFYLVHSNARRTTFDQLSDGFFALLGILMDLLIRTDLLRKQANDYTYDPCGFVLIDEPETHLHLEMQYQILPLLTILFPNLQFIVATHSPAVASSIKNATVFDLGSGQALGDSAAGSSFSELMQTHFGLENEYSNVADKILDEVAEIGEMPDRAAARERLQRLLEEQGRYMSPVLRLDVQAHLLHLQREQAA